MIDKHRTEAARGERLYDDLVEEIAEQVEAGEPLDIDAYATRYPQHAGKLRRW